MTIPSPLRFGAILRTARLVPMTLVAGACEAQEISPRVPPSPAVTTAEADTPQATDSSASAALSFYRRPGSAVCPSPFGPAGGPCLPCGPPRPCGVGPTDCGVNLPYTGFLFYGTDPRDDDPVNHTWTTRVGDQGDHGARKTVRHVRRFGY